MIKSSLKKATTSINSRNARLPLKPIEELDHDDHSLSEGIMGSVPRSQTHVARVVMTINPRNDNSHNHSSEQGNVDSNAKSFEILFRRPSQSRLGTLVSKIEEIKNSPSLEGCGKDSIYALVLMSVILVSELISDECDDGIGYSNFLRGALLERYYHYGRTLLRMV